MKRTHSVNSGLNLDKDYFGYICRLGPTQTTPIAALLLVFTCLLTACSGTETSGAASINDDTNATEDVPTTVKVSFDISVPAYQSDKLQVQITWGNHELSANWIGDEYWTITGSFAANTENQLVVTFYDDNGAIVLAEFQQSYRTSITDAETLTINDEQFQSDSFDTDGDGLSNLDELKAQTDPLVDESTDLEIVDFYLLSYLSRMSVSRNLESMISTARPYIEIVDTNLDLAGGFETFYKDANIDAYGNGTLTYNYYLGSRSMTMDGTRTQSNNIISWEGVRQASHDAYNHTVNFNNSVTFIDGNKREFAQEIRGSNVGTYTYTWETSVQLTGELIEGTSFCIPKAGTVSITERRTPNPLVTKTEINKGSQDKYWKVVKYDNDVKIREYYVRQLIVFRGSGVDSASFTEPEEEDKYYFCDFW